MKILMSKLFTVSGKISNQLMTHKTIKFNKLNFQIDIILVHNY